MTTEEDTKTTFAIVKGLKDAVTRGDIITNGSLEHVRKHLKSDEIAINQSLVGRGTDKQQAAVRDYLKSKEERVMKQTNEEYKQAANKQTQFLLAALTNHGMERIVKDCNDFADGANLPRPFVDQHPPSSSSSSSSSSPSSSPPPLRRPPTRSLSDSCSPPPLRRPPIQSPSDIARAFGEWFPPPDQFSSDVVQKAPIRARITTRGGKQMRAIMAIGDIQPYTFLGWYAGVKVPIEERQKDLVSLTQEEKDRHTTYDMEDPFGVYEPVACIYVPVDRKTGVLLPEHADDCQWMGFMNEASEFDEWPNVAWCVDLVRHRVACVSVREIKKGDECLVWYGSQYAASEYTTSWTNGLSVEERENRTRGVIEKGNMYVGRDGKPSIRIHNLSERINKEREGFDYSSLCVNLSSNLIETSAPVVRRVAPKARFGKRPRVVGDVKSNVDKPCEVCKSPIQVVYCAICNQHVCWSCYDDFKQHHQQGECSSSSSSKSDGGSSSSCGGGGGGP